MKNILFDLAEMTKKHPNKTAFIFLSKDSKSTEVNQISFKELDEKSSRAATLLSREGFHDGIVTCLLYTSPSPRDKRQSRMPSSA